MAMGVVDSLAFEKEIERLQKMKSKTLDVHPELHKGRSINDINVPNSLRKIIGETNELDSRTEALSIAKDFGISPSSVSAYAHGSTSTATYHTPKKGIENFIEKKKRAVSMRARTVLNRTLNELKDRDFSDVKVTELAGVAKSMSGIMKDMDPPVIQNQQNNNTQVLVYKPRTNDEDAYQIIDVNE